MSTPAPTNETLHSYDPREGHGLRHDPLAAIVGPRPIGWISTLSADGVANLAPYSFFNVFNYRPPIVVFSSLGYKDTVRNIEATGEFTYNLATRPLAEAVNASSADAPPEVDEFELAGLTKRPSVKVKAPSVLESPVAMECRLLEIKRLQDSAGTALDTWMVFGEVVMIHIDKRTLVGPHGTYDTPTAQPILRAGGPADYFEITDATRFQLYRPR
jgi:flavin reductase (DIM6/NTAB) family NADH-FMN oxidoreductase RutF